MVFLNRFNFSLNTGLYGSITSEILFQPLYQVDISYNKSVNVQKFDTITPASSLIFGKTVNNTNLRIPYRNIYSYGFCLDPYSTQSTGSANLQDTVISLESSPLMTTPHNVHVYYSSFKFFKFEGGYGSLLFTQ